MDVTLRANDTQRTFTVGFAVEATQTGTGREATVEVTREVPTGAVRTTTYDAELIGFSE